MKLNDFVNKSFNMANKVENPVSKQEVKEAIISMNDLERCAPLFSFPEMNGYPVIQIDEFPDMVEYVGDYQGYVYSAGLWLVAGHIIVIDMDTSSYGSCSYCDAYQAVCEGSEDDSKEWMNNLVNNLTYVDIRESTREYVQREVNNFVNTYNEYKEEVC